MRSARPREPWREAAPRRPLQSPRLQQRPRPPPRGPPGRRPRAPRARDARALPARRPPERGRAQEGGAGQPERIPPVLSVSSTPTTPLHVPALRTPSPWRARAAGGRAGGQQEPSAPPVCPVPPGRLQLRREPEPPGGRGRADDDEEAAAGAERRKPPGPRLLRGRARCASCGFPVSSPCWCTRPPGAHLPDCPRLRQRGP